MAIFRFVSHVPEVGETPTTRLDINSGALWVGSYADGLDLSPAPKRRVVASSMLADGELITWSAWGNRTLKIPIQLKANDIDDAAAQIQALGQELARTRNVLMVQLGSNPVYFRTYAAPDYAFSMMKFLAESSRVVVEIPAEPFAIGPKETLPQIEVSNNIAGATNPMYFDIEDIKGDVETPLIMRVTTGVAPLNGSALKSFFALRRHGTVANVPFTLPAEQFPTRGADTTLQPNDPNFSGAGSNYVRTTFATDASMINRLEIDYYPLVGNPDDRGEYTLWVRVKANGTVSPGEINIRMGYGYSGGSGRNVLGDPVDPKNNNYKWLRLGIIPIPAFADPVTDGFGPELNVHGLSIALQAQRISGSGTLDWDAIALMPADDISGVVQWSALGVLPDYWVIDSVNRLIWGEEQGEVFTHNGSGNIMDGGWPMVLPNTTNRVYWMLNAGPDNANDVITHTTKLDITYWPLYTWIAAP